MPTPRVLMRKAVQVHTVIGLMERGLGISLVPSVNAPVTSRGVVFRQLRDLPRAASIGITLADRVDRYRRGGPALSRGGGKHAALTFKRLARCVEECAVIDGAVSRWPDPGTRLRRASILNHWRQWTKPAAGRPGKHLGHHVWTFSAHVGAAIHVQRGARHVGRQVRCQEEAGTG